MKKTLIALAAVSAAGIASAQSSVTIFGVVDATLARGTGSISSKTQLTNSGYNSSRRGFRGTEDLGGGMAASFWLEAGLNNDDGTGASTNKNNQFSGNVASGGGMVFGRRSTVSLSGSWGEVRAGRDYSPQFWNLSSFDPFGYNGVGTTQVGFLSVPTASGAPTANFNVTGVTAVRVSNSVAYFLPSNLGGMYGQVTFYLGENASNTTAKNDGNGWGGRVGYASGPFDVAFAGSRTKYAASDFRDPTTPLSKGDVSTWNIRGPWNFGVAKVMANYDGDKIGAQGANPSAKGKGWLLGASVPVGAGEIRASYSTYKVTVSAWGANPSSNKFALGYVQNLSKRTALYATYARLANKNGATTALNGATTAINASSSGLDLGVRHSF